MEKDYHIKKILAILLTWQWGAFSRWEQKNSVMQNNPYACIFFLEMHYTA